MVILVTGASGGIGAAAAKELKARGHVVYGTYRRNAPEAPDYIPLYMDVNDEQSVQAAIDTVLTRQGRLDALINNAGMGIAGPLELTDAKEAELQFSVNLSGALTVARLCLPALRKSRGRIVCTSSLAARVPIPFQSLYSASKAGLEVTMRAVNMECRAWGVKCVCVELGDTKTGFTHSRKYVAAAEGDQVYGETFFKSVQKMERDEQNGYAPEKIARCIAKAVEGKNPPPIMVCGAFPRIVYIAHKFLPARTFDWVVSKLYA